MKKVNELIVKVTYTVGFSEVEMPDKVYDEMLKAESRGAEIDLLGTSEYSEAALWLSENIREGDSMECKVEIEDVS